MSNKSICTKTPEKLKKKNYFLKAQREKTTIPEVPELHYALESSKENDASNQELEEEKKKHVNRINKPRIKNAKTEAYEPYQEPAEMNSEINKKKINKYNRTLLKSTIKLQNQNTNSNKKIENEIDSSAKDEYHKINIRKDNTL
ncbi:41418_t:CDS:2, partial [Gigaspora margarita]